MYKLKMSIAKLANREIDIFLLRMRLTIKHFKKEKKKKKEFSKEKSYYVIYMYLYM